MSLTRLHSQTAPPTRRGPHRGALIVIGHGTGARAGDGALHQLVADIAAQEIYGEVYGAVLHGVPSLGDVLAKIEAPGRCAALFDERRRRLSTSPRGRNRKYTLAAGTGIIPAPGPEPWSFRIIGQAGRSRGG